MVDKATDWLPRVLQERPLEALGGQYADKRPPELVAGILQQVQRGASLSAAAEAHGYDRAAVIRWRKECPTFNRLCNEAAAKTAVELEADIVGDKDWKAKIAWLRARSRNSLESDWQAEERGTGGITVNISVRSEDASPIIDVTPVNVE